MNYLAVTMLNLIRDSSASHAENLTMILLWNRIKSKGFNRGNNIINNDGEIVTVTECFYV